MRIAGLASGLDIDSMVKEMMKARRQSLEKLTQQRTTAEWQQENYREVSVKVVDFRNKLSSYSLSSAINAKTSSITGNANAISISTVASTASGSLNITVDKVATASNTVFTYDPDGDTTTTNSTTGLTLEDLGFAVDGDGNGTISVNGVSVAYKGTDKLSDLASKINATKSAKATASFNDTTGQFSITNTLTGGAAVSITGFSGDFGKTSETTGDKAKVKVNGINYEQDSNQFTISGVSFTAKQASGAGGSTTVAVVTDSDKILNTIKSFINDYNSMLDLVNGELNEKRHRTFKPLTQEQKNEMKEKEVELWEEKAHSGLLRNDAILSQMVSDLRIASTSDFSPGFNIQTIGISTGTWSERGKLVITDEAKLKKAIEDDPDKVMNLFAKNKAAPITKPGEAGVGIFDRMADITMEALELLSKKAGTSMYSTDLKGEFLANSLMSTEIGRMKNREKDLTARLADIEDRYYKQFAAMEAAINKFNAQSSSLMSFM